MEENGVTEKNDTVIVPDVVVNVDNVTMNSEQYTALVEQLEKANTHLAEIDGTLSAVFMFCAVLVVLSVRKTIKGIVRKGVGADV